jgi:hypothetical protein
MLVGVRLTRCDEDFAMYGDDAGALHEHPVGPLAYRDAAGPHDKQLVGLQLARHVEAEELQAEVDGVSLI